MHRCGSHGNMVGPCSCGSSLSILFAPLPNKISNPTQTPDTDPLASSSMVDCTLSLGTPSTRQTQAISQRSSSSSCMSHLCWDMFHSKQPPLSSCQKSGGARPSSSSSSSSSVGDTRLAAPRRCANCDTTSTPLWRNGPRGPKSLCNACGIRYKKEERRATTSALETPQQQQQHHLINHHQWTYAAQPQRPATALSPAEFRLIEDDGHDGDSSPFLSWRLSVPPPPPDFPVQYT
ncbi:GATA transcription factor 18-like [Magnolia sinica]|uniref:GATA transcription factor 18-like n=1 Tax=Magnolia sinica TaxID=86752 RepID=UPI002658A5FD|nr:GATA transcription factor 18-like [Magnolia sinica]